MTKKKLASTEVDNIYYYYKKCLVFQQLNGCEEEQLLTVSLYIVLLE